MHVAIGFAVGLALAWPRVSPEIVYYEDGYRPVYHADRDCAYGHLFTFRSRRDAEAVNLTPCDKCVLQRRGQKVANGNGQQSNGDPDDDVRPVTHRSPQ